MGYLTYKVKVANLMNQLKDRGLLQIRGRKKAPAQYLVNVAGISPDKAYQVLDPERADLVRMDVLWKIYVGLAAEGVTVLEKGKSRPVTFKGDIFEEVETAN